MFGTAKQNKNFTQPFLLLDEQITQQICGNLRRDCKALRKNLVATLIFSERAPSKLSKMYLNTWIGDRMQDIEQISYHVDLEVGIAKIVGKCSGVQGEKWQRI